MQFKLIRLIRFGDLADALGKECALRARQTEVQRLIPSQLGPLNLFKGPIGLFKCRPGLRGFEPEDSQSSVL